MVPASPGGPLNIQYPLKQEWIIDVTCLHNVGLIFLVAEKKQLQGKKCF